jgi:hypothetical protein
MCTHQARPGEMSIVICKRLANIVFEESCMDTMLNLCGKKVRPREYNGASPIIPPPLHPTTLGPSPRSTCQRACLPLLAPHLLPDTARVLPAHAFASLSIPRGPSPCSPGPFFCLLSSQSTPPTLPARSLPTRLSLLQAPYPFSDTACNHPAHALASLLSP